MTAQQEEEEQKTIEAQMQLLDILHGATDNDSKKYHRQLERTLAIAKITLDAVITAAKGGNVTCIQALLQILAAMEVPKKPT